MLTLGEVQEIFARHGEKAQRELIAKYSAQDWFVSLCIELTSEHFSISVRRYAHEALAGVAGRRAAVLTKAGLKSQAMTIRLHTLCGIASGAISTRIDWLFPLLQDESGGIRSNVIDVLQKFRPKKLKPFLALLAQDPKEHIRKQVKKIVEGQRPV